MICNSLEFQYYIIDLSAIIQISWDNERTKDQDSKLVSVNLLGVVAFHVEHIVCVCCTLINLTTTYCVWFHSLHFKDNHSKLCHVHTNDYDDVVDDTISSLKTFWSWPLVWIYLVQMKCILCTCMYTLFISSKVTMYFYVDH